MDIFLFRTKASLAGALTMLQCLPEKIRPVVKPLMESIKKESNEILQVIIFTIYFTVNNSPDIKYKYSNVFFIFKMSET